MKHFKLFVYTAIITILAIVLTAPSVSADCGAKPSIELHIENPPDGNYCVDLLEFYNENPGLDSVYTEEKNYDMIQTILTYSEDGWHTRQGGIMDSRINKSNPDHTYNFTYMVPSVFKIIIVTEDLQIIVSDKVDPSAYNCVISFDVEKCLAGQNAVTEDISGSSVEMAKMFIITFIFTVIIEAIVFLCFRMKLKEKGIKAFLGANLVTQLLLYILLIISPVLYIPAEIIIPIIELRMLGNIMDCEKKSRKIACIVTANVLSFLLGIPLFFLMFWSRTL